MRLSLLISLSLLLLSWQPARAQLAPADDFFHSGAQFYISNNIPKAREMVDMGLKLYPGDEKLKKLDELLKQQSQQQQSQQNQQQQNQQNQSQPQQNNQQSQPQKSQQNSSDQKNQQQQDQQQQKQNSQEQQKQDEQKQNQSGQKKEDGQKQQQQKSNDEKQNGGDQAVAAGQMTPEEAKQLLDAQKGDEKVLQLKPQVRPESQNRPVKDW
jgi:hypothetical protein